jgi:hypothetical protein
VTGNYAGKYIYDDLGQLAERANILDLSDGKAKAAVATWDASHVAASRLLPYRGGARVAAVYDNSLSMSRASMVQDSMSMDRSSFVSASGIVPEPASWAMMIFGFLVTGLARRRLQRGRSVPIQGA